MRNRFRLLSAMLGVAFALTAAMPSTASAQESCRERIAKAERRLDRAIRRHGPRSPQAERRRDELERVRARCGR